MKAVIYNGKEKEIVDKPLPTIQKDTDVIVKVLKTTICGTDLHILSGHVPAVKPGTTLGHEGIGVIVEKGTAVKNFKVGDKVIISCVTACGTCEYCKRQLQSHCKDGSWILGHLIDGLQAEYARIPHADNSLYHIPEGISDRAAMLLSDILPTAYEIGVLMGNVQPGRTVAVVGAGPVGLSAVLTAKLFSPKDIIVIDLDESRLNLAKELGATHTINPSKVDVVKEIHRLTNNVGVDVAIEAVGIEPTFKTCQDIIAIGGNIANVGVHGKPVQFDLDRLWIKNIYVSTGLVNANTTSMLIDMVKNKVIVPDKLLTHEFKFKDVIEAYDTFKNANLTNAVKVAISFED